MCSQLVNHFSSQHHWRGTRGGGEDLCGLLRAHCLWTLIIYNNLRLSAELYGIDHGFFKYICGRTLVNLYLGNPNIR